MKRIACGCAVLLAALLLFGCGSNAATALAAASGANAAPGTATEKTGGYTAPEMALSPFSEEAAQTGSDCRIDTSHTALGYVAAGAVSGKTLKFQVVHGDVVYNYDLPGDGTTISVPLQSGDGTYKFRVMENTTDTKYAEKFAVEAAVALENEQTPFLRPSQLVAYTPASACVAKAAQLAQQASDEVELVGLVYAYIRDNIRYDTDKAKQLQNATGYLPDPDETLRDGKGICYDYAALAAAMLRSQGVPTKLITGYVAPDDLYHAWNMIWLEESGWITVELQAPANAWERIDLTFAAGNSTYAGDGTQYTDRYCY